jgi:hypothetical protein
MTVAFTQYPTYPIPGRPIRIGLTVGTGNYARVYMTAAPLKSSWHAKLEKESSNRIMVHYGDERVAWEFTPDVAGKFVFTADDITKGATSHGGRQVDDPNGWNQETVNDTTSAMTIIAGSKMDLPTGAGKDRATIRLWLWNDTVRETNVETHGEATPAIVNAKTPRIENVCRATAVVTALANLIDKTSSTLVGTGIDGILTNAITKIRAHMDDPLTIWHTASDNDNQTTIGYQSADNPERMQRALTQLLSDFDAHMRNDNGTGTGTAQYHINGVGQPITDWVDALLWTACGSQAEAAIAVADVWRAYEAHRVRFASPPATYLVHIAADAINTLTALPATSIFSVHYAVLSELAKTNPSATAPATSNPGAQRLAAELGASES